MSNTSTSNSGGAKLDRALHQITNAERLIASLPKQFDHEKALTLAQELRQMKVRIKLELAFKK